MKVRDITKKAVYMSMSWFSTIIKIIGDIAYAVAALLRNKEKNEKLALIKELESLKNEIKKAIDSGNEAKLAELLKKRKEIEDKIRILNSTLKIKHEELS